MGKAREGSGKLVRQIGGKKVTICPSAEAGAPIVYLNAVGDESAAVLKALPEGCPAFTLVTVSGLTWDHDMAPWDAPAISALDTPCTGGADEHLRLMLQEIVPAAEELAPGRIAWRGIAGYSLAGLFALYSLYRTDAFSRAASMSGSLWFPDFAEYATSQPMRRKPERLYLSLGDRECKTSNPYLRVVQERTEELERFYRGEGIDTFYRLNPGGHFSGASRRTAAGIAWLLETGLA